MNIKKAAGFKAKSSSRKKLYEVCFMWYVGVNSVVIFRILRLTR